MDRQMPPNVSFLSGRDTAPAYWMYNILWVPLLSSGWATTRSTGKNGLFRFTFARPHELKGGFYCGAFLKPISTR
jgi:hypothetical protein